MKKNISDYQNIPTLLQTPHLYKDVKNIHYEKSQPIQMVLGKLDYSHKKKKKRTKDLDLNCLSLYKKSTQNRSK